MKPIPKPEAILLGSPSVGKTSPGNTIMGFKQLKQEFVDKSKIIVLDTSGRWKDFPELDTCEAIKEELVRSMFLCPPGPHVFLLVIDADASFNAKRLDAATHVELLGDGVRRHTIIAFTTEDWLRTNTTEQHTEGKEEALQSLSVTVVKNKKASDGTQIRELLEKIRDWGSASHLGGTHEPFSVVGVVQTH